MSRLLLLYSTTDGHTVRICERMGAVASAAGAEVVLRPLADAGTGDLAWCDIVVIGASIRYGKHKPEVAAFIARHQQALTSLHNAFFSVNVVARKPGKDRPEANPYLQKFLRSIAWQPQRLAVFAGKIDYPIYGWLDRTMIRLIMKMTHGPTDPTAVVEFTHWPQVEAFARQLVAECQAPPQAALRQAA